MNVLSKAKQSTVETLLENEVSQYEISGKIHVDRKTVRRYGRLKGLIDPPGESKSPTPATGNEAAENENPPPRPPGTRKIPKYARSACEAHHEWIEKQVDLGRNAMSIYQDLVEQRGFTHKYNSVKRYVRCLKRREPERFDWLEHLPGEEAQVDYGQGAWVEAAGKKRRPRLFVMTLKYSRRSFRKVVWKSGKEEWARLHEEALRYFGGGVKYVVLDNLKEGVLTPDIYEPELNPVFAAMLRHYKVAADPARRGDPNRKGTVENAIGHTQDTALKGRVFASLEEQNAWLRRWEENWAARRIHGRTKRQVEEMFQEEKPYLLPLPAEPFRYFREEQRTVDDAGLIQVENSFYSAMPAAVGSKVTVRIYDQEIALIDPQRQEVLRRHGKSDRPGAVRMDAGDRIFNPSRQTAYLLAKAGQIGPFSRRLCERWFEEEGRAGQRRMYGVVNLARRHERADIEAMAEQALAAGLNSYRTLEKLVEARAAERTTGDPAPAAVEAPHPLVRRGRDYGEFFECNAHGGALTPAGAVTAPPPAAAAEPETADPPSAAADQTADPPPDFWRRASWRRIVLAFALTVDDKRPARPDEIWVKSPFTGEAAASLHMDDARKVFKDFSSGLGGGILRFCQEMRRRQGQVETAAETVRWMIAAGIVDPAGDVPRPPPSPPTPPDEPLENAPVTVDLRAYLRWDHPEIPRRGLSADTCRYLGCGFLPPRGNGRSGSPLNGRLVFQIRSVREGPAGVQPVIVSHAGRALSPEAAAAHGKYWAYPFRKGLELYNQDLLLLDGQARLQLRQGLILVEGFMDVAALVEAGYRNVAALMGVEITPRQIERLTWLQSRLAFPDVLLFLDRDRAGRAGARVVADKLRRAGFQVSLFDWDRWVAWPHHPPGPIPNTIQDPGDMAVVQLQWLRRHHIL